MNKNEMNKMNEIRVRVKGVKLGMKNDYLEQKRAEVWLAPMRGVWVMERK